jgi:hypothetical protein
MDKPFILITLPPQSKQLTTLLKLPDKIQLMLKKMLINGELDGLQVQAQSSLLLNMINPMRSISINLPHL